MSSPRPAGQHTVRRHNSALVLNAIADPSGHSRAEIAARTGLTKATVSSLVDRMIGANLVVEGAAAVRTGPGRRGTALFLAPDGPHGLGVEIGVDYLATCLIDLTGEVRARWIQSADNRVLSPARVLSRVTKAVRTALAEADRMGVRVGGMGVAVPGLVESATGILRVAPNLGWREVDVRGELRRRAGLDDIPVLVGNEANFAALAELWQGGGLRDFVHVSGEIGIGAGIVVDGGLFEGVSGFGGEIGHMMVDPRGPECACGSRGCLERMAGQEEILRQAGVLDDRAPEELITDLLDRLAQRDRKSIAATRSAARWIGIALSGVVNLLDLPVVVLGGTYARLAPWLWEPLRAELAQRVVSAAWSPVEVTASTLGAEAAVRGAAGSAVRAILADPDPFITAALI
ncbi:ROK family transcriptional regulator [Umezawaea sp. Da 62-37]|uniref:ROK family transcriptional regulator n=1 Tax=Umezawaea sp. Da 62-37 TaxID=3075927 RepID=UPI0028F6E2EA|nr:ROK family transcriptional regulator [Umezawaea sp. Da 62-37]WNV89131.1 ROK family transcriptional regulator [Umezawaea sp. Da 62-37]